MKKRKREVILGIDPATISTGWSILEKEGKDIALKSYGLICAESLPVEQRLLKIYNELSQINRVYNPTTVAMEDQFLGVNVSTLKKLSWVRGVILLLFLQEGLPVKVLTPKEIKLTTAGKGSANKDMVRIAVCKRFGIKEKIKDDISDAIAIALTCALQKGAGFDD